MHNTLHTTYGVYCSFQCWDNINSSPKTCVSRYYIIVTKLTRNTCIIILVSKAKFIEKGKLLKPARTFVVMRGQGEYFMILIFYPQITSLRQGFGKAGTD